MRGPLLILLVVIAVVVLLAVVIGFLFAGRSRKQEAQRVEAAGIRADADALGATSAGQAAFAQQAEERAGVVRAEAEEKAREAEVLESEARARRDAAEETRRDYEAELRRADEIDPDVDDSDLPPVQDVPQTRAERRAARDEAEASAGGGEVSADSTTKDYWASTAPAAAGGAAAASGRGDADEDDPQAQESARVASAADYRDDVEPSGDDAEREDDDVYDGADRGTGADMSQTEQSDPDEPTSHDHDDTAAEGAGTEGMAMVTDPDAFASTEPVTADEQSPPVERDAPAGDLLDRDEEGDGRSEHSGAPDADDTGEAAEPDAAESHVDASSDDPFDPTPSKDWAADEGEMLDDTHERGERLERDRADLEAHEPTSEPSTDAGGVDSVADTDEGTSEEGTSDETSGRRVSTFTELRDGGYGVGSAAPLDDGGQPLDHPVQAYRDTMTFRAPGDPGYDSAEPDVWFYDESAAERSGFSRSEG